MVKYTSKIVINYGYIENCHSKIVVNMNVSTVVKNIVKKNLQLTQKMVKYLQI